MLTIVYGEVDEAISDPDTYFNHTYSKKWFDDPFVKEMIRAAYGPEMGATARYIADHFNCYLYAPESFEWLLLKVMFSKDPRWMGRCLTL